MSWAYLILRAVYNPLVFDEATTFFNNAQNGNFIPGLAFWSANNHVLNSLLMYHCYSLIGMEEWVLRLPNLLAFPVFLFFNFQFWKSLDSPWLKLWALSLLFGSHYLLEFFAYARGYGLMLAAIAGSLWYLKQYAQNSSPQSFGRLFAALSLGILANVSWLPLMALIILSAISLAFRKKQGLFSLLLLLPLVYALWYSWQLKSHQQLYYGGQEGFIHDSLRSLHNSALGDGFALDLWFACGALMLIAWLLQLYLRRKEKFELREHWLFVCFLLISLFYPISHWLLGLNFPFDRALIYWFYFGLMAFIFQIDRLQALGPKSVIFFLLPSLAFPFHFLVSANLKQASFIGWQKEQIPDAYYWEAVEHAPQSIGGSYLLAPQWYYYQVKNGAALSAYQKLSNPDSELYLAIPEVPLPCVENFKLSPELSFTGIKFIQNDSLLHTAPDYHGNGPLPVAHFKSQALPDALSLLCQIKLKEAPQKLAFVWQGFDAEGKSLHFEAFEAKHYLRAEKDWQEWRLFVVLKDLNRDIENWRLFLWNPQNEEIQVKNLQWKGLQKP